VSTRHAQYSEAPSVFDFRDFGEVLEERARANPTAVACQFLYNGDGPETSYTYRQLHDAASRAATTLTAAGAAGSPVLLLLPPGPDYIAAFFGCVSCPSMYSNRPRRRFLSVPLK